MERRDFLKITALSGATLALDSCGSPDQKLIRFIPEEKLVPGVATWKPSLCTVCPAGCGMLVRVMEGQAEVVRHGQRGLIEMGLAKKLEGNPKHPVNRGKLCSWGQAGLQVLYNPDRLGNPLKRTGPRGTGEYEEVTWEDALKELSAQVSSLHSAGNQAGLTFLMRPLRGHRRELIERFLKAYGAPSAIAYEPLDEAVLRRANALSFGRPALPTLDLARADYLIAFGADFLGTWNSPVSQSIGYGEMRRGRPERRGTFVQVESRMSQTGANADMWVPCRPGTEGVLALGMAHVILSEKLFKGDPHTRAGSQIAGWAEGLPEYTPQSVEQRTGVPQETVTRLAREITRNGQATAIVGGAPLAETNGLFTALAVNALESLVDAPPTGGKLLSFTPEVPWKEPMAAVSEQSGFSALSGVTEAIRGGKPNAPKLLMLYDANPVFSTPPSMQVRESLEKIPYIVSFGSFVDETSILADLILPDNAALESWLDDVPESGTTEMVATLAPPAVLPLRNTRAMPDVLLNVARGLGGDVAKALPWENFQAMLRAAFVSLRPTSGPGGAPSEDDFWTQVQAQGGWWSAPKGNHISQQGSASAAHPASAAEATAAGASAEFPFRFLPYASQSFRDGSLAHLPWLQEMPDVVTTAMWSSWVELNPQTAKRFNIQTGDIVKIMSSQGSIEVPAVVEPGIAPDVVAVPIGQGHENFGRFATGRGANPLSILAPLTEPKTGALAWAGTRVALRRSGGPERDRLILFASEMSRYPEEKVPR